MNSYEERQERKRQRLLEKAEAAERTAQAAHAAERRIADGIPPGQPILVGHHSEGRHRRDIARMDRLMRNGIEAAQAADEYTRRAAAVGRGGISSDDPDAIHKLQAKLEQARNTHERMVKANRFVRKEDRAGLQTLGFSEAQIERLFTPDFAGRIGFPDYAITNSNANIRRMEKRLKELAARPAEEAAFEELQGAGWRIYAEDNRVCIAFDDKPEESIRKTLKGYGFKWSRERGAWVRHFSTAAIWAAKQSVGVQA